MKKREAKKRAESRIFSIILRYLIMLLAAIPNLWIFYAVFTPLTVYPVFFLLKLFFNASLIDSSTILINNFAIKLVEACIAGSAYYLLFLLNLSASMTFKKRISALLFSFALFLMVNILRIFFFSVLFFKSFSFFNATHLIFWYVLSIAIVFFIWLAEIKIFKIREIPVYSDLKFVFSFIKGRGKNA